MEILFTPWRYRYIRSEKSTQSTCFFCEAARDSCDPERLVVHHGPHHIVLLNRHPYTNGHLMIAPRHHFSSPEQEDLEAQRHFWPLAIRCQRLLHQAFQPDGINVGMNLGQAAGAGVPGHYHLHLVPRWIGDTNFMTVTANTRIVPEELEKTLERFRSLFRDEEPT